MKNILLHLRDRVLIITINRESKLNALNKETLSEIHRALADANNDEAVGGIIITGAGPKAFIAGADISEFASYSVEEGRQLAKSGHNNVFDFIQKSSKPIVAAINGFALGGGLELALACHIRVASLNAKMGLPEVSLGLIPGYGGTQRLTQLVGTGRAMEIIMTAGMISADEAYGMGLVNHIVEQTGLLIKAEEILAKILKNSPFAVSSAIKAVNAAYGSDRSGYSIEIEEFAKCFGSEDFKEGVDAFLNKRKPDFKGK